MPDRPRQVLSAGSESKCWTKYPKANETYCFYNNHHRCQQYAVAFALVAYVAALSLHMDCSCDSWPIASIISARSASMSMTLSLPSPPLPLSQSLPPLPLSAARVVDARAATAACCPLRLLPCLLSRPAGTEGVNTAGAESLLASDTVLAGASSGGDGEGEDGGEGSRG